MVFKIPDAQSSLLVFGESREPLLTCESLKILVWNVWKGRRGEAWRRDLAALSADRDLVLLQEAVTAPEMRQIFHADGGLHEWHMAASFQWNFSHATGVITGAKARPTAKAFLRGAERELFMLTPKVTLSTTYDLKLGASVMIINTHVVNFTTTASYVRFVQELVGLIENHAGAIVLAGDFNTWNVRRWVSLLNILDAIGLKPVDFHGDPRVMKLDHVFVRGLRPLAAHVRHDVRTSDHFPLLAEFALE